MRPAIPTEWMLCLRRCGRDSMLCSVTVNRVPNFLLLLSFLLKGVETRNYFLPDHAVVFKLNFCSKPSFQTASLLMTSRLCSWF